MKKTLCVFITLNMIFFSFTISKTNAEEQDTTETGTSLHLLLNKHGIETEENNLNSIDLRFQQKEVIKKDETIIKADNEVSATISKDEKKLLAQLVHAEAKGEPYVGKVAVAEVVLNRVDHDQFPDTIKQVIYQENAFEPVSNNSINEPADKEAYKAVQDALTENDENDELLYFYNPDTATSDWIQTREVIKTIGNHAFAI